MAQRHSWAVLTKIEPKPAGSQGGQAKQKTNISSDKGADLKMSVTKWIMNAHRKDKEKGSETFCETNHAFGGGQPKRSTVGLNI